jgi:hypothetical protein
LPEPLAPIKTFRFVNSKSTSSLIDLKPLTVNFLIGIIFLKLFMISQTLALAIYGYCITFSSASNDCLTTLLSRQALSKAAPILILSGCYLVFSISKNCHKTNKSGKLLISKICHNGIKS